MWFEIGLENKDKADPKWTLPKERTGQDRGGKSRTNEADPVQEKHVQREAVGEGA